MVTRLSKFMRRLLLYKRWRERWNGKDGLVNVSFPRAKGEPREVGVDAAPGHPGYFSDTDLRDLLKQAVELVKTEPHRVCINTPNMRTAAARLF